MRGKWRHAVAEDKYTQHVTYIGILKLKDKLKIKQISHFQLMNI